MSPPLVAVVDDDESVRESVPDLLRELGFAPCAFESAHAFLASECSSEVACLIVDIFMPGMTGPELHEALLERGHRTPTVFITARPEEAVRDHIVPAGALVVAKPFHETELQSAIAAALRSR